jgi:DNA-3-methyladenine glycosylase
LSVNILAREFFEREANLVAMEMIGKRLVRILRKGNTILKLAGTIVETEAYGYKNDKASHAFNGITKRNKVMFERGGLTYVYFTYGNHYCFNITAHLNATDAGAILIRSIEPIVGIEKMKKNRNKTDILNLTSGPGNLTQAICIDTKDNGLDVTDINNDIIIENSFLSDIVLSTKRIGIAKDKDKYWRFVDAIKNGSNIILNRYVSKKKENIDYHLC